MLKTLDKTEVNASLTDDAITPLVMAEVGGVNLTWKQSADTELRGLDYVRKGSKIRNNWEAFWPSEVALPSWDCVGRVQIGEGGCWEWICVKVFNNPSELLKPSLRSQPKMIEQLHTVIEQAQHWSRASNKVNWMELSFDLGAILSIRSFLSAQGSCGHMFALCQGDDHWPKVIADAKNYMALKVGGSVDYRFHWLCS